MQWKQMFVLSLLAAGFAPTASNAQTSQTHHISGYGTTHAAAYTSMVNNSLWIVCRNKGKGYVVPGSVVYDPPLPGGIIVVRALATCGSGTIAPAPDPGDQLG